MKTQYQLIRNIKKMEDFTKEMEEQADYEKNKILLKLYQERLECLMNNDTNLSIVKKINEMKKYDLEHSCISTYAGMTWGELVLKYEEHFTNTIESTKKEIEQYQNK